MKCLEPGRGRRLALAVAATAAASLATAAGAAADTPAGAGAFVLGDQNAVVGNTVTFWGAQWWKDNSLSGGSAPAAFKGYADTAAPACGQTWTTRPGNSSDPPAGVQPNPDAYGWVPMVVSTRITKSGPVISGDTAELAWVLPNPGYADDPGHAGTGKVMALSCSDPAAAPSGNGGSGGGPAPS